MNARQRRKSLRAWARDFASRWLDASMRTVGGSKPRLIRMSLPPSVDGIPGMRVYPPIIIDDPVGGAK